MNKKNILVVDDTPANLRLLTGMLAEQGYKARPVPNGSLALTAARAALPDLILLDINMPGMDGYEVCKHLKKDERTQDVPVIFISALDEVLDKVKAFQVGGVDYITKPFQFEEVLARVETHLTLIGLQQQLQEHNETLEKRVEERTAELVRLHAASNRFVPQEFLSHLNKTSITGVNLGDQVQKEMTVMFSDIRNFTTLSERMSPQENFNYLNGYLRCISPVIRQHGGFIDKYLGDGIMALFPERVENAIQAAVEMRREVARYNQLLRKRGDTPFNIGIGLNTGNLMLGIIGEEQRMQGTVISDAVNVASRLEGLNKLYDTSILICQYSLSRLENPDRFSYRFIDKVLVKGKTTTISVHEVFDGDSEKRFALKQKTKPTFEKGIKLYYEKKFAEANVEFSRVIAQNPDDKAARIYLERAADLMVRGVPPDWAGVEAIAEKTPGGC